MARPRRTRRNAYRDAGVDHILVSPEDREEHDRMRTVETIAFVLSDPKTRKLYADAFAPSVFSGGYREVATNVLDVNFLMDPRHDPNHSALAEFEGTVFFYDEEYDTGYLYNRDVGVVVLEGCGGANDFDASNLI
jgi:hypothetical protein